LSGKLDAPSHSQRYDIILLMLADGATVAEMSDELIIAESTVKHYIMELRKRFGAKNNTHLVALAYQKGILYAKSPVC
jgi:DNA-binding CsgD family transcriptional regulator